MLASTSSELTPTASQPKHLSPSPSQQRSWLIAIAYWLAGGFIKSGLGNRIAYLIVAAFGKTSLGLTYSLVFAEALLSPAIPSVAARAGGIFFPLAKVGGGGEERSGCLITPMGPGLMQGAARGTAHAHDAGQRAPVCARAFVYYPVRLSYFSPSLSTLHSNTQSVMRKP